MFPATDNPPVIDEQIWCAWVLKGKLRGEATARKFKMSAGVVLVALAVGSIFYFFAVR
jgi:hypothetical protein